MAKKSLTEYFEQFLKVAPLSHALWRAQEAYELSKYRFEKPILDLGCGFGEFSGVFFSSRLEVGVDINENEILKASSSGRYKKTMVADARKLPFHKDSFQTIVSISTLEHIIGNEKVFKETFRILKPGGKFIFTVPTSVFFDGLIVVKFFRSIGLEKLSFLYYRLINKAFKHVFLPSEEVWLKLAKKAGFEIEKVEGTVSPLALNIWELGLPLASPSQISKILLGKRYTILSSVKIKIFKPFIKMLKTDPNFKANILVLAKKPK